MSVLMQPWSLEAVGTCPAGVWWPEPCGVLQWLCWEVKADERQPGEGNQWALLPGLCHGALSFSGQRGGRGQLVLRFGRNWQWHSSSGWWKEEISWLDHPFHFLLSKHKRGKGLCNAFFFFCTVSALKLICCIEQRINCDVLLLLWGNWLSNWVQKALAAPLQIFNLAKQMPLSLPLFLTGSDSPFSQPTTAFVLAHTVAPKHQRLGLWWLSNLAFSLLDSGRLY